MITTQELRRRIQVLRFINDRAEKYRAYDRHELDRALEDLERQLVEVKREALGP